MKKNKLNLGCGTDIRNGFVNLDIIDLPGVDVLHDLNIIPYPFKNDTFEEVYTSHVLEHVDNLQVVMEEIKRICKKGSHIFIRVPHFSCGVSYRDPTHRRLFSYFTFDYFTEDCFYNLPKFRIVSRKLNFTRLAFPVLNVFFNPIININPGMYERFFCWIFPCAECIFELEVIK